MQSFDTCPCPYCGEPLTLALDASAGAQEYIEDCQVCCRPIVVSIAIDDDGRTRPGVRRDDE